MDQVDLSGEFIGDKFTHKGEYKNNLKHGYGEITWTNGAVYTGHFKEGKREGYGEYVDEVKTVFKGLWKDGKLENEGLNNK